MGNTPNIRFKGFTDDWEQRKLGEVFQEYSEKNHPELPALTIIQGGGTVLREESERKLQYDKSSLAGYKMVREDDFIVHLRSFEGGLEKSNHNGLISPAYHTFHGDEVDSRFYYPYFRSYEFIKHKLVPHVYGIRDGRSIDIDSMKTIEIPWTSYEEQKKIGDYIESLDTLITLHQRKCDETKKLKKFMLQKMFPKKDAKKPEIRFAGFTDDWEQRKFGDIGSIAMCKRIFKEQTSDEGEVPFYKIGTFGVEPDAFISKELFDEYKTKYPYPNKGDILISASGSIGRTVEFTGKDEYFQDSNIVWLKHGNEIDNSFLKVLYSIVEWSCEGSTIKRLYNDNFLKTEFMLPQIDEQIKLGTYFSNLDNLITLHQRKLFLNFAKRNDWEQRKFGSLLKEIREKTKIENEDTLLSCAIDGMYLNSELFSHFRGSSNIGYLKVKKNDLILSAQNLHLGNCNVNLRFEHGIISPAYKVYELVTCDPFFIQAWVKQDSTKDFFLNASTEGASVCRKNIVWDELYKQTLPIPKLKEQEQIGQYFNELDNLITLHRRAYYNKKGGLTNVHNDNQQHYAIL